ncbi:uncharacterized protein AruCF_1204 [Achromobacter ruhlandii]|nr:uncharacterized protein AruCF_1204 [Achromobacter ruhlandii]
MRWDANGTLTATSRQTRNLAAILTLLGGGGPERRDAKPASARAAGGKGRQPVRIVRERTAWSPAGLSTLGAVLTVSRAGGPGK